MPFCTRVSDVLALEDELIRDAQRCRTEALKLPPGNERDALLKKARHADTAVHIGDWADSPGLKPPE
jgi:hypothetical protein